jgi:eukaryotic-like serine/threonine-protein kinase
MELRTTELESTAGSSWNWQLVAGEIIDGKYRLIRPVGHGGMAEVWLSVHEYLKTEVVLKFAVGFRKHSREQIESALERFRFEAQLSARFGRHTRHVVAVHDTGVHREIPYLVMEYVAGRTMLAEMEDKGVIHPARLADIFDQIADALGVAHAMDIVHRDLKPSNVLLLETSGGVVAKVTDFGIAKGLNGTTGLELPRTTDEDIVIGSIRYMSPEQFDIARRLDQRGDLWALGVLAYQALTGSMPFEGETFPELMAAISTGPFEPPSKLHPELPRAVDAWFERALAKDPGGRFQSVAEMACAYRVAIKIKAPERPRRLFSIAAGGVVVLGVLTTGIWPWAEMPQVMTARSLSLLLRAAVPGATAQESGAARGAQAQAARGAQAQATSAAGGLRPRAIAVSSRPGGALTLSRPGQPGDSPRLHTRKEVDPSEIQ